MKLYPTIIKCYEDNDLVFSLTAKDDECAELTMTAWIEADSWPDVGAKIQEALNLMNPERLLK